MKWITLLFFLAVTSGGRAQSGDSIRLVLTVDARDWSWQIRLQNGSPTRSVRLLAPSFQTASSRWTLYDAAGKLVDRRCLMIDHYEPKGYDPYLILPPGGEKKLDASPFETLDKLFCRIDPSDRLAFAYVSDSGLAFRTGLLRLPTADSLIVYSANQRYPPDQFVVKASTACSITGSKLTLVPYKKGASVPYACTYEQDKLFAGYPVADRIQILAELLGHDGDTAVCSKRVCRYGYTDAPKPHTQFYSTQIDALYLLTVLAVGGYATDYCPYPVLEDTVTGKEIDDSSEGVAEVYAIYRQWFRDNAQKGFRNFPVPLRNERYRWYGMRKSKAYLLDDNFKITGLGAAFAVVGVCLD